MKRNAIAIKATTCVGVVVLIGTLVAVPAAAQRKQARVWGVITDAEGAPIEGVRVTARDPSSGEVRADELTNAAGEYSLLINDASVTYRYLVEKEGYVPWEGELEVAVKGNAEYNFTLPTADGQSRVGDDGSYSMHPDAVEPFTRGSDAARAGDFDSAFTAFEEVLAIDDQVVPAYVALAAILLQRGEPSQAAERAAAARELDPNNAKAVELLYTARKQAGAPSEELTTLLASMEELAPAKAAAAYAEAGLDAFNSGDLSAAQESLSRAVGLDPSLASAHFQLGLCYVNQGDSTQAKAHFEQVLALAPDSEDAQTAREMLGYLE